MLISNPGCASNKRRWILRGGGEGFGGGRFDLQLREHCAQIGIVRARQPLRAFCHADANLGGGGARVSESQNGARRRALDQQAQNARRQKPCFAAARASGDDRAAARIERAAQIGGFHRARKEKSAAAMSFVIAPIDTQSIPAAAICARTDARAPPAASKPDASNFARPRFAAAARRICASEKLSSKTRRAPAARAISSCAKSSTSISISDGGAMRRAAASAASIPPAARMWIFFD